MSTPDLSSALLVCQWKLQMANPRLKCPIIVLDQVRCKDHHPAKVLQTDEQLTTHRVNGLLRSLCDLGEPLREQRIGFIDKEDRMISLSCMEDRFDIFRSLPMKLALNLRIAGNQDGSIKAVGDSMGCQRFSCSWRSMKIQSSMRKRLNFPEPPLVEDLTLYPYDLDG